jgi:hypothetical protein
MSAWLVLMLLILFSAGASSLDAQSIPKPHKFRTSHRYR